MDVVPGRSSILRPFWQAVWRRLALALAVAISGGLFFPAMLLGEDRRGPEASSGRGDEAQFAAQHVEALIQAERLKAGNAFLRRTVARREAAAKPGVSKPDLLDAWKQLDAETRRSLAGTLEDGAEPVAKTVEIASDAFDRQIDELAATWRSVRTSINERRVLLFEVKASRHMAAQLASLLSVDKRWFWLFGEVAVATLAAVVFHERRHELRRMLHGIRARALGLFLLLCVAVALLATPTIVTFLLGDQIYDSLIGLGGEKLPSPHQAMVAQKLQLKGELERLEKEREVLHHRCKELESRGDRLLADILPAGNQVPAIGDRFQAGALAVAEALGVLDRVTQAMETDLDELAHLDAELNAQAEATARYLRLRQWIRGSLGLALIGLTLIGGVAFYRGVKTRQERTAETCPLCLSEGHLEAISDQVRLGDRLRDVAMVECRNVLSEEPYEECDYTFMDAYRSMTKLCFPTLGVPQAGKTHWLAMLYWTLNRGNYPRSIEFEKIKSRSSQDFDMIVEEILNSRIGTAATQRDRVPHPLVFNFRDRDRLGRSNVLVNIFDYSGEVTLDMGVEDYRRRRALDGDGFLFFLDPTYPSDPQAKALADFREDLRLVKQISAGRRVKIPVALCVSKIDLLASRSLEATQGDVIGPFYDELSRIDPTGEAMTLKVIEARSRLISRLRDTIWPGWQIERQIDDLFGGRYCFFPLTPVGLDGLGESDLSLRTISPFGLLEPLLWLLEMNGYPVLE